MRRIAGVGMICISLGMFLQLLIRDRLAGFLVMVILALRDGFASLISKKGIKKRVGDDSDPFLFLT